MGIQLSGTTLYLEHSWFIPSTSKRKNPPIHFRAKKLGPTCPSMEHKDDGTSMNWEASSVHQLYTPHPLPHKHTMATVCKGQQDWSRAQSIHVSFLHATWCCLNFSALPFATEDNTDGHGYKNCLRTGKGQSPTLDEQLSIFIFFLFNFFFVVLRPGMEPRFLYMQNITDHIVSQFSFLLLS